MCILEAKKSIADSGCTLCVAKFANETDTTLSKIPYVVSIGNFTPNLNFQTRHGSNIQVVELHRLLVAVWTLKFKSIMKFMYLWDLSSLFGDFKITLYGANYINIHWNILFRYTATRIKISLLLLNLDISGMILFFSFKKA